MKEWGELKFRTVHGFLDMDRYNQAVAQVNHNHLNLTEKHTIPHPIITGRPLYRDLNG